MKNWKPEGRFNGPEAEKPRKIHNKTSLTVRIAMVMALESAVFALFSFLNQTESALYNISQTTVPVISSLLFAIGLIILSGRATAVLCIPVAGAAFCFVEHAILKGNVLMVIVTILLGIICVGTYVWAALKRTVLKWIPACIAVGSIIYRIAAKDLPMLLDAGDSISFIVGIKEVSNLCMLVSLLIAALAIKKPEPKFGLADLPKIKTPHAVIPDNPPEGPEQAQFNPPVNEPVPPPSPTVQAPENQEVP